MKSKSFLIKNNLLVLLDRHLCDLQGLFSEIQNLIIVNRKENRVSSFKFYFKFRVFTLTFEFHLEFHFEVICGDFIQGKQYGYVNNAKTSIYDFINVQKDATL